MRALRFTLGAAAVAAIATITTDASAADTPAFSDLPAGHATAPPDNDAPAFIPANEKVPGFFVVIPHFGRRTSKKEGSKLPPNPGYVVVVASAEHAKRAADGNMSRTSTDPDTCFTQSRQFRRAMMAKRKQAVEGDEQDDDDPFHRGAIPDWEEGLGPMANVQIKSDNNPQGGVTAVHSERLVRDSGGARIETVDAWVDPATHGVRKIGAASLPLKLVGSTRGLEVWGAREERVTAKGPLKVMHFVVVPPKDVPSNDSETTLLASDQEGRSVTSSSCSHLRLSMSADDHAASSAVLKATLRLPDRESEQNDEDGEGKRARVREAAIHLGLSKTKRDKDPILSVAFGWSGRETTQFERSRD